jgi:hypothetical protein
MLGAIGVSIFGVDFLLRVSQGGGFGRPVVFGAMAFLSLLALGVGLLRTRRMWSVDAGGP